MFHFPKILYTVRLKKLLTAANELKQLFAANGLQDSVTAVDVIEIAKIVIVRHRHNAIATLLAPVYTRAQINVVKARDGVDTGQAGFRYVDDVTRLLVMPGF